MAQQKASTNKLTTTIGGIIVAVCGIFLPMFLSPDCAVEVTNKLALIIGTGVGGTLMALGPSVTKKKDE